MILNRGTRSMYTWYAWPDLSVLIVNYDPPSNCH
jgi:hypothetical protein